MDLALFDHPFPNEEADVDIVIESKRMLDPLGDTSVDQAARYAARYERCRSLVVSDGVRYKLLGRKRDTWIPEAYANLLKLRARHPTDAEVAGAGSLFVELLP